MVQEDPEYVFRFPEPDPVSPPILGFNDVDFNYPKGPTLFSNLNFGLDMESRLAIVGPNGALLPPVVKVLPKFWQREGHRLWPWHRVYTNYT